MALKITFYKVPGYSDKSSEIKISDIFFYQKLGNERGGDAGSEVII